jgi:hypothetical protein
VPPLAIPQPNNQPDLSLGFFMGRESRMKFHLGPVCTPKGAFMCPAALPLLLYGRFKDFSWLPEGICNAVKSQELSTVENLKKPQSRAPRPAFLSAALVCLQAAMLARAHRKAFRFIESR